MLPLPELRIVIPACNEAWRIEPTLRDYCATFGSSASIVVVANGCTDETSDVVRNLQNEYQNLRLLDIRARIGKGGAVRAGLANGIEPYRGFTDADGSTSAKEFARLYRALRESGADGIIGSRWLPGAVVAPRQPLKRRMASRAFNSIVRVLLGLRFSDTQCGAKIFRRAAMSEIIESLEVADFAFDIEVLWRLSQARKDVLELPTVWSDKQEGTKINLLRSSWAMFKSVLRLRLRASIFWRVPFIDYFGRKAAIPVKRGHSMLLLGTSLRRCESDAVLGPFVRRLRELGVSLRDQYSELGERGASPLRFLLWYIFGSHREYDAIIEVAGPTVRWVPAISSKPSFLVEIEEEHRGTSAHARWYRRSVRTELTQELAAAAAEEIVATTLGRSPYLNLFIDDGGVYSLRARSIGTEPRVLL